MGGHRGRHGGGARITDYSVRPESAIDSPEDRGDEEGDDDGESVFIKSTYLFVKTCILEEVEEITAKIAMPVAMWVCATAHLLRAE